MPEKYEKIAISLPAHMLRSLQELSKSSGESRSSIIQRVLDSEIKNQDSKIRDYVEGYKKFPELEPEIQVAEASAAQLLAGEPWE